MLSGSPRDVVLVVAVAVVAAVVAAVVQLTFAIQSSAAVESEAKSAVVAGVETDQTDVVAAAAEAIAAAGIGVAAVAFAVAEAEAVADVDAALHAAEAAEVAAVDAASEVCEKPVTVLGFQVETDFAEAGRSGLSQKW